MISIVLVTFNRLHLLRRCVQDVLNKTSPDVTEIIVWNNASTDGTKAYLSSLQDRRLRVTHSDSNIGTNGFARAFRKSKEPFMIELDDDIIDAPDHWDRRMLDGFRRIPKAGYIAANVVDDGKSVASDIFYRKEKHRFTPATVAGVKVLEGPVGGYCTITSREVFDQVGGFRENPRFNFWHEDEAYAGAVARAGYRCLIFEDIKVFHASGPAYSSDAAIDVEKDRYYQWCHRRQARRDWVKGVLERVPPVRRLNARFHWYRPPTTSRGV